MECPRLGLGHKARNAYPSPSGGTATTRRPPTPPLFPTAIDEKIHNEEITTVSQLLLAYKENIRQVRATTATGRKRQPREHDALPYLHVDSGLGDGKEPVPLDVAPGYTLKCVPPAVLGTSCCIEE